MIESTPAFPAEVPSSGESRFPQVTSNGSRSPEETFADYLLNVLVVEDDDVDFMLVSRDLKKGKRRLILSHANTLAAAIRELDVREFDVILTDLHLPDSSGLETVKQLKEHCGNAPILVLTGLDDEDVEHKILESGAQDYLPKGTAGSDWTRKAIEHAVQRQRAINEMNRVTAELQESHRLLRQQSDLREQDNRKLERLYQTAHEFLAKASHDIRNPLAVIREHVSIVRDGLAGRINTEQASMLEKAMVRTDDVNAKLDDLLDSSKLDSGLLDICRRPCHVSEIVDQVRSPLSQRAAMRYVNLEIQASSDHAMVYCDEQKASRVLSGLVVNAINACGENGNVSIWVRHAPESEEIRIGVTDDGVGIMPSQRDRLSDRFAREGLMTEPEDKLLGLGLSIAARFCRLNLGQLHVESEVGLGSIFWFTMPTVGSSMIFPRWLSLQGKQNRYVQLISFCLGSQSSESEKRDTELLLTYLAENDELLLQTSPSQWWLATGTHSPDTDARLQKASDEIARLTDVRAASPMFDLEIESRAIWDMAMPRSELIEEYRNLVMQVDLPY